MSAFFFSRRPVGDAGERADAIHADPTLRTAKRLQKTAVAISLIVFCAAAADAITLDATLSRTLEKNPEIVQARIALEQAAGRRLVFHSSALPDLKIQGLAGIQGGKRADEPALRPFDHRASWRRWNVNVRRSGAMSQLVARPGTGLPAMP